MDLDGLVFFLIQVMVQSKLMTQSGFRTMVCKCRVETRFFPFLIRNNECVCVCVQVVQWALLVWGVYTSVSV